MFLNLSESGEHTFKCRLCESSCVGRRQSPLCGFGFYAFWWFGLTKWWRLQYPEKMVVCIPLDRSCHHISVRLGSPWLTKPGLGQGMCILRTFSRGFWCLAVSENLCHRLFFVTMTMTVTFYWELTMCPLLHISSILSFILSLAMSVLHCFSALYFGGQSELLNEWRPKAVKKQ